MVDEINQAEAMMKLIPLSQGKFAQVDDEDFEYLNQWKWHYSRKYAGRGTLNVLGLPRILYMHREIMQPPTNMEIDHIDNNGINNQRNNLRICTTAQNQENSGAKSTNKSGYKGVSWNKKRKKWLSQIRVDKTVVVIGYFDSPIDAAHAYDNAARKYHGEFANINFKELP